MGGKSRKSGGVSQRLIQQIKSGNIQTNTSRKKDKCGTSKYKTDESSKSSPKRLFGGDEETGD